ncbi:tRNA (guanine-N(7)-)-methyltransferase non-catalytic subunit wdr4 [Prorops nasuta]|uniref:tRNA (guanine-N(7)-)-methyltransferase non-catalytic subunit wdr4 n=1 Tax=Prorops nasuta TaxID=863751 RepID=UPI0034CE626D
MNFLVFDSTIIFGNNDNIIIYNLDNHVKNLIILPTPQIDQNCDLHSNPFNDSESCMPIMALSCKREYLVICKSGKQLFLYELKTKKLASTRLLKRAARKIKFLSNNDIIIADKTGDVYLFFLLDSLQDGKLLLGHLSIILDFLITSDENHIITTDRNGKIRVSKFPNSYNIEVYCLGHTQFVTNISILPHDKQILISVGGDGCFILWDYTHGKELLTVRFEERISNEELQELNKSFVENNLNEPINMLPVKHMRLCFLNETSSLVVISFFKSSTILVYKISNSSVSPCAVEYVQTLKIVTEPLECFLDESKLWIFTANSVIFYKFINNVFEPNNNFSSKLDSLNRAWEEYMPKKLKEDLFLRLYIKKYDNLKEYFEKKKLRISR